MSGVMRCSFCACDENDVEVIITSFGANICNGCVDSCVSVIADHRADVALRKRLEEEARAFVLLTMTLGLDDGAAVEAVWEASQVAA